jgi:2-phosphosulfolactate phosphatase
LNIDVIFSAKEVTGSRVAGKTVVVIDVLRATTVMITALKNGAKKVVPVLSPTEAFEYRRKAKEKVILAGERNADPIAGFDFGNSPLDMSRPHIAGATLVMTTSNGTRAIRKSVTARALFVASFLNAGATIRAIRRHSDVVLVCSGSNGVFTMEDTLCAGFLADLLSNDCNDVRLSDAAIGVLNLYRSVQNDVLKLAAMGRHYLLLKEKGLEADLAYCFKKNEINLVCQRHGNEIVALDSPEK